jgi:hypothetical protein
MLSCAFIAVAQEVALAGVDGLAMLVQLVGATGLSNIQVSFTLHFTLYLHTTRSTVCTLCLLASSVSFRLHNNLHRATLLQHMMAVCITFTVH